MSKINVLLIEDDQITVFLLKKTIEPTQLANNIVWKSDGREAIDFLTSQKDVPNLLPDIILLDLNMPVMDGWEFLNQYQLMSSQLTKQPRVYICTSSISPEEVQRAEKIECIEDYVIKPLKTEVFYNLVVEHFPATTEH